MEPSREPLPLIRADGSPWPGDEIASISEVLDRLEGAARIEARDSNASSIAHHDSAKALLVSGPGTGKSTLFKARMQYWLDAHPDCRVAVATFVRKLVTDLQGDIANDRHMSEEQKARVDVFTLHRLARSIVERNHGTGEVPLEQYCLVITGEWEQMVWLDAVELGGQHDAGNFPWASLLEHLYDGEPPTEAAWASLRTDHVRLQQFYNALTFADLILFATQAVLENPELVSDTLFIVDEFQDFNLAEDTLIRAVTSESPGVLLAGDDDQALYEQLRRGHPSIIRGYYRDSSFVNTMLPFCSRCEFHICKVAEAFLAQARPAESIEKVFLPLDDGADAHLVTVIASTSPSTGIDFVEGFINEHQAELESRQQALSAGTEKDPFLLILTPAREMKFLNVSGARERLHALIEPYCSTEASLSTDYWKLRDYFYSGLSQTQNYRLRQLLFHEGIDQPVVTSLLREALETSRRLCELEHEAIRRCLESAASIAGAINDGSSPDEIAELAVTQGIAEDAQRLARELETRPLKRQADESAGEDQPEQNQTVGAIDLRTIVGAKGLSADHVIVLGCDDVNLQHITRSAFFVALTRGRNSLTLMACVGGGGAQELHPFVLALPGEHTRALYVKAGHEVIEETIAELQTRLEKWAYARSPSKTTLTFGRQLADH